MNPIGKTVFFSALISALMFGFSFALVPLYNAFCKVTGINVAVRSNLPIDQTRTITVQFVATNNRNLPWEFYPLNPSIDIHPEENGKIIFFAKNNTDHTMIVQAIPSYAPPAAALYINKLQCFCFQQQKLKAGESIKMPVILRISKKIPDEVQTITIAYTLFDVTPKLGVKQ